MRTGLVKIAASFANIDFELIQKAYQIERWKWTGVGIPTALQILYTVLELRIETPSETGGLAVDVDGSVWISPWLAFHLPEFKSSAEAILSRNCHRRKRAGGSS